MAKEKITIEQIAQALGISKATVSRALSGKGRVSPQTKKEVLNYIRQSGQRIGVSVPELDNVPTHNLALVIPSHFVQLDLPFLRKCMGGICRMATQRGYDILLCYADPANTQQLERQLSAKKVDGVILSRTLKKDPCVDLLKRYNVPFVALGRQDDPSVLQVDNDQTVASAEMTRYLLQLGIRRIAYMGGSPEYTVNTDRLAGYRQALMEAGVPADKSLIYTDVESEEKRLDDLEAALASLPECILCCDDAMAFSVLDDLKHRNIRVPEQIRVASLYDSEMLQQTSPSISAVQFDAVALGATACRMLLDVIAGKEVPSRIVYGHQLILRESTK